MEQKNSKHSSQIYKTESSLNSFEHSLHFRNSKFALNKQFMSSSESLLYFRNFNFFNILSILSNFKPHFDAKYVNEK